MADKFLVSTTGTESSVVLDDIGGVELIHPTTDKDLYKEAPIDEVNSSKDIQDAIDRGAITATDGEGTPISDVEQSDHWVVRYTEDDRMTSTTSDSFRKRLELEYKVDNPGMYRFAWYMEYAQSRRGYPIEVQIIFNDKEIATIVEDNYYARKEYFRTIAGWDVIYLTEEMLTGSIVIAYRSRRGRRSVYIQNLKLTLENIHVHNINN